MTKEKQEKKAKPKNTRYTIESKTKEVFDNFFKENNYEILADMYEEIGEYAGISPSTVGQMRLNGLQPSYISAIKIAEFMGVEPTDIWEIKELDNYVPREKCIIEGCKRVSASRGLCMKHIYIGKELKEGKDLDTHSFRY